MRIVFGLHLDGLLPAAPRSAAGETALGPRGLLQVLETQLGLPTPNAHPSEAPFSYLQCLREASTPDRFFHRSLDVDPINVARTLLDWRAQWHEAGWNGTFPDDVACTACRHGCRRSHRQDIECRPRTGSACSGWRKRSPSAGPRSSKSNSTRPLTTSRMSGNGWSVRCRGSLLPVSNSRLPARTVLISRACRGD